MLTLFFFQVQGTIDPNLQLTNPLHQPLEAMYNEGAPEFVVDQGMYYPSATNYGYICTGNCHSLLRAQQVLCSILFCRVFYCEQDWNRLVIGMTTIEFLVWMVKIYSSQ